MDKVLKVNRFPWGLVVILGVTLAMLAFAVGTLFMTGMIQLETGFTPLASPTPLPINSPTPLNASIDGVVWHDLCASGREGDPPLDITPPGCIRTTEGSLRANGSFEIGEPGIENIVVQLGTGACPAVGLMTTTTDVTGRYQFRGLDAGTYCVSIDPGSPPQSIALLPGNWTAPIPSSNWAHVTVSLKTNDTQSSVNFGWDPLYLPEPAASPTQTALPPTPTTPTCINRVAFVQDITIPDFTNFQTGAAFEKVWRLRNNGTCTWTQTYKLIFISGYSMGGLTSVPLASEVAPGSSVDVKINLTAPTTNGNYRGNWMLANDRGSLFGLGENGDKPFWVQIVVGPAASGGPLSWRGEYFGNRNLKDYPVLIRYDTRIDFNWQKGSPSPGLSEDNFSVRWTTRAEFEAATYRFKVSVNDGARLYVDDKMVVDAWQDGSFRDMTGDLALAKGTHDLRLEYYDHRGEARIRLTWEKVSSPIYADWKAEYWNNRELQGSPILVRNDPRVSFDWGSKSPAVGVAEDGFSARWTRTISFKGGTYRFVVRADDGIRVYVDGKRIINEWHANDGSSPYTQKLLLTSGKHKIVIEYFERTGKALVKVEWEHIAPTVTPSPSPTATQPPATSEPTPTSTPTPETTPPPSDPELLYRFADHACDAVWQSEAGTLSCPGSVDDKQGFVLKVTNPTLENGVTENEPAVLMSPEWSEMGWIEGVYPSIAVQAGDQFRATIACPEGLTDCNVGFRLLARLEDDSTETLEASREVFDGTTHSIQIDLSSLAGRSISFVFTVYAEFPSKHNQLYWVQPGIWR